MATVTHLGAYQRLGEAQATVHRWLKAQGREAMRPCWEVYGHWEAVWDQEPERIRTDGCYWLG